MTMQQGPEAPGSLTVGAHLESAPNRLTLLLDIGMSNGPIGDDEIRRTASVSLPVHIDLNAMLVALSGLCPSCALTVKAEETHEGVELTIIPEDESNPTDIPVPVKPKSLRVFQNPPPSDGEGPPTEILLAMEVAGIHPIPLVAEFRNPEVVDALIATLASHRHSVWPENPIWRVGTPDTAQRPCSCWHCGDHAGTRCSCPPCRCVGCPNSVCAGCGQGPVVSNQPAAHCAECFKAQSKPGAGPGCGD